VLRDFAEASPEEREQILRERARALADARVTARREAAQVLVFSLAGERYAVAAGDLSQIVETKGLSPLPGAPRWLLGAIVARSRPVPVLDLRQLLELQGRGLVDLPWVVVLEDQGDTFGIAVEAIEGRVEVPTEGLSPATRGPFRWVAPDRLALLDLAKLAAAVGAGEA
jgi:purine-binding chemotaxis protein CheW